MLTNHRPLFNFQAILSTAAVSLVFGLMSQMNACAADTLKFAFGPDKAPAGYTQVLPGTIYGAARGFGYELDALPDGTRPFYFSIDLPEGNYNVTVTLGDDKEASSTTVKSELRRLMVEDVKTAPGQSVMRTFTVNVRTPRITPVANIAAGEVQLKVPRETELEAWNWDRRLTLEFNGVHPSVRTLEITPANVPTVFLLGDSTVCDQPAEPYNSWGQMLPRFFKPGIAVANHGESGETYRDSIGRRRLDKVLSVMNPGDMLIMQFGHNDQKQIKTGKGGPFTTYKAEIKIHVDAVRARGGLPVIISPMERRGFDENGKVIPSLIEYAEAARQAAQELNVPFIDLNKMSKAFYEALGPEGSKVAFAEPSPGRLDNTHHDNYGSYELAKMVVLGLRQSNVPAARYIVDGFQFDPGHPDPVSTFYVPPSPRHTDQRPLGDESHK
jgi:lysophospholipase L1-like esterase